MSENNRDDGARLRVHALERRVDHVERDTRVIKTWMLVLAGFVLAAVLVCAFEWRHFIHIVKGVR